MLKQTFVRPVVPPFLCGFAEVELEAPSDLVTSEETHHSFRVSWTPPESPVEKYRVTYQSVDGGAIKEER